MIKIMFYSKMMNQKNTENLNLVSSKPCYLMINYFDVRNNIYKISNNSENNKSKLYGRLFYLNLDIKTLVTKLNKMPGIKLKNRDRYYLTLVDVFLENKEIEKDVYVIL